MPQWRIQFDSPPWPSLFLLLQPPSCFLPRLLLLQSVTAIACTSDSRKIVSGGKDGRVRMWDISGQTQTMELSFKEHKSECRSAAQPPPPLPFTPSSAVPLPVCWFPEAVCYIALSQDDEECLSAAEDGSCIVWNLRRGVRSNALFASTMFRYGIAASLASSRIEWLTSSYLPTFLPSFLPRSTALYCTTPMNPKSSLAVATAKSLIGMRRTAAPSALLKALRQRCVALLLSPPPLCAPLTCCHLCAL